MDGVLWQGDLPLPGLIEFFKTLREKCIHFILATNNNTLAPEGFVQKAKRFGVEVSPAEIITASIATIHYLHEKYPSGSRIYVIGEAPLKKMITDAGYVISEQDAAAVVATMDRALT